jgi:serine/threonine protein kinase
VGTSDDERPTEAHDAVEAHGFPSDAAPSRGYEQLLPGDEVSGYIIDGELGRGGMGVVYSATHPVIGKRAAVKVLKSELSRNPAAVERFVMEARGVNQIGHPNIVDIFAFGALEDGCNYYVMDYLTGETLRERLTRGPLHIAEAASVIDEVSSALIAAHDKGIIHRDLKPDNVFMVSVRGRWPEVRILDWGLLKLSSNQSAVSSGKYRTIAGSLMGTPVYMSPEQARASEQVDHRCDIYSLGVMAYEILSGVVPFRKGSSIDTILAHQDDPVPPLADKCPGLPEEIIQLIEAMLAKDPDGRPSLVAIRAVLKRLKGNKIPTMTAAGLELPTGPGSLFPFSSAASQQHSFALTTPRQAAPVDPQTSSMSEIMPLPAPPLTPMPDQQQSVSPYASMNLSAQHTLAGHSMPLPAASNPRLRTPPQSSELPLLPFPLRPSEPALLPTSAQLPYPAGQLPYPAVQPSEQLPYPPAQPSGQIPYPPAQPSGQIPYPAGQLPYPAAPGPIPQSPYPSALPYTQQGYEQQPTYGQPTYGQASYDPQQYDQQPSSPQAPEPARGTSKPNSQQSAVAPNGPVSGPLTTVPESSGRGLVAVLVIALLIMAVGVAVLLLT